MDHPSFSPTFPASSVLIDVDGNPVPLCRAIIDELEHCFDLTKLQCRNNQWYYGERIMAFESGRFIFDYSEHDYRNPEKISSESSTTRSGSLHGNSSASSSYRQVQEDTTLTMENLDMHKINQTKSVRVLSEFGTDKLFEDDEGDQHFFKAVADYINILPSIGVHHTEPRLGFDAEQLLFNGAVHCVPCRPTDLKFDPQLELFYEDRFSDTPQDVMEVIKPALALAENMILKGNPKFWVSLALGKRIVDTELSNKASHRVEKLEEVKELTPEAMHYTSSKLQILGKRLLYHWKPLSKENRVFGRAERRILSTSWHPRSGPLKPGELWPVDEPLRIPHWKPYDPWQQTSNILIDKDWYILAKKIASTKHPDVAWILRFNFFFAVNICHEIAHAFEGKCGDGAYWESLSFNSLNMTSTSSIAQYHHPRVIEAYFKDYPFSEMGAAFEWETFGGRVHPVNGDLSMKYGLCVYQGDDVGSPIHSLSAHHSFDKPFARAVPMGYIEELQQQSFWTRPMSPNGLLIPECGPQSLWTRNTSTISWREDLLSRQDLGMVETPVSSLFEAFVEIPPTKPKRNRFASSKSETSVKPLPKPRRRFTQSNLRKYQVRSDIITTINPTNQPADDNSGLRDKENTDTELVEEMQYRPPSPGQSAIDDHFEYEVSPNTSSSSHTYDSRHYPQSDSYDPLTIPPHKLKLSDKWVLFEEYCLLAYGWNAPTFLSKRQTNQYFPVRSQFVPTSSEGNWGQNEIEELRKLREQHPDRSFPHRRALKLESRRKNRKQWQIMSEMEELCTYKGHSRIYFQRSLANGMPLPEGMTVSNFDQQFRHELDAYRTICKAQQMPQHLKAIQKGQVISPAGTIIGNTYPTNMEDIRSLTQSNKITRYLRSMKPASTVRSSRSAGKSVESDISSKPPLVSWVEHEDLQGTEQQDQQETVQKRVTRRIRPQSISPSKLKSATCRRYRSRGPTARRARSASPVRD